MSNDGGVKGYKIELLNALQDNECPIYVGRAYSKYYLDKIYVSKYLPYPNYEIIDEKFNRNFDELYNKKEKLKIEHFIDRVLRLSVEKDNDVVRLQTYFSTGIKKFYRQFKDQSHLNSESYDWFENGNLKRSEIRKSKHYEKEFYSYEKEVYRESVSYYENGKIEIEITSNFENGKETYIRWFENGKKQVEFIEGIGHIYYNELGIKIKTDAIHYKKTDIQTEVNLDFPDKEGFTQEMRLEKEQSDLDWLEYINSL